MCKAQDRSINTLNQTVEYLERDRKRMKLEIDKLTDKCTALRHNLDDEKLLSRGLSKENDRLKNFIKEKLQTKKNVDKSK